MDMTRYEKIDGREALRRLADGETVYGRDSAEWTFKENGEVIYRSIFGTCVSSATLNDFVQHKHLYAKKPFDVRQAMRDKPDEWVGAYEMNSFWYKVGFDTKNFMAVDTRLFNDVPTSFALGEVDQALSSELDACIPLDEVPADAR